MVNGGDEIGWRFGDVFLRRGVEPLVRDSLLAFRSGGGRARPPPQAISKTFSAVASSSETLDNLWIRCQSYIRRRRCWEKALILDGVIEVYTPFALLIPRCCVLTCSISISSVSNTQSQLLIVLMLYDVGQRCLVEVNTTPTPPAVAQTSGFAPPHCPTSSTSTSLLQPALLQYLSSHIQAPSESTPVVHEYPAWVPPKRCSRQWSTGPSGPSRLYANPDPSTVIMLVD